MSDQQREQKIEQVPEDLAERSTMTKAEKTEANSSIAEEKEKIRRFKRKLAGLKRPLRFIHWGETSEYARDLSLLLEDIRTSVTDPLTGVQLVAAFFEADEDILGHCDDSSGHVGDLFRYNGKDLFLAYASRCSDWEKETVADILLELNLKNDYGVRDLLVDCAGECLDEPVIRRMIAEFQRRANAEKNKDKKERHLMLVESLARQIRDAELFEKTRTISWGKLSTAAFIDIAEVWLAGGNVEKAHFWIKKIPEGENFLADERDSLLLEIYRRQGDREKLIELLYGKFRDFRSSERLQALLEVLGKEKRDEVIDQETARILENTSFRVSDAEFLLASGKIGEAAGYIVRNSEQLDGREYERLPPLAEQMESKGRSLAAGLIYRSLLSSILDRACAKAYSHAARYLRKLDALSADISDWQGLQDHETFTEQLYLHHGRKKSFWSEYEVRR